jgi:demethylmenaquinone methyltransferase/2-methoxy-6-polyprenyl-1,4-benzoquinol methylase
LVEPGASRWAGDPTDALGSHAGWILEEGIAMSAEQERPGESLPPHAPLTGYYEAPADRRGYVDDLFHKTAHHYDTIERIFGNGGLLYRRYSLRFNGLRSGMKVLDVAVGTGAVARGAAREVGPQGRVFGVDPNRSMMNQARKSFGGPLTQGVAQSLPFASDTFDFVTMGIALRHVSDLKAAFGEYLRVLKPGGRLWILEGHVASSRIGHALTSLAWGKLIPALTLLFTRSRDAKLLMDYYWDTVDQCVPPDEIVGALDSVGFEHARVRVTVPGAFCEYKGQKAA